MGETRARTARPLGVPLDREPPFLHGHDDVIQFPWDPPWGPPARSVGPTGDGPDPPTLGGEEALVTSLALLLGGARSGAVRRARELLARRGLADLASAGVEELVADLGLELGKARRLVAAFDLARRAGPGSRTPRRAERPALRSARRVFELLRARFQDLEQEAFLALLLDGKHRLRGTVAVSLGTLTSSLVHPREVYRPAIRSAAAALLVTHNHPSGDPEPSAEDVDVTRRLHAAGELLGIPLLDHVVLGDGSFVSLRERLPELFGGRARVRASRAASTPSVPGVAPVDPGAQ